MLGDWLLIFIRNFPNSLSEPF